MGFFRNRRCAGLPRNHETTSVFCLGCLVECEVVHLCPFQYDSGNSSGLTPATTGGLFFGALPEKNSSPGTWSPGISFMHLD